jgi:hypothetical protein
MITQSENVLQAKSPQKSAFPTTLNFNSEAFGRQVTLSPVEEADG